MSRSRPLDFDGFDFGDWVEEAIAQPEIVRLYLFGSRATGYHQPRQYDVSRQPTRPDSDFDVLALLDPQRYEDGDGDEAEWRRDQLEWELLRRLRGIDGRPVHLHLLRPDGTMVWMPGFKFKEAPPDDPWVWLRVTEEEGYVIAGDRRGPRPYPPASTEEGFQVALGRLRPKLRDEWLGLPQGSAPGRGRDKFTLD